MEGDVWSGFAHDPRDPSVAPLRASDADREVIYGVLADAFADGRLDRGEYDERSAGVQGARTLGELPPIVSDLVPAVPARTSGGLVPLTAAGGSELRRMAKASYEEDLRNAIFGFIGPTLICWAVWAAITFQDGSFDPHFPWPLIVMAATLANLIKTAATRDQIVASEVRRLEKKQAKELEKKRREP